MDAEVGGERDGDIQRVGHVVAVLQPDLRAGIVVFGIVGAQADDGHLPEPQVGRDIDLVAPPIG